MDGLTAPGGSGGVAWGPNAPRTDALLARVERCQLRSAERLRQLGRDDDAARAERFAASVRVDLEDPRQARRFYELAGALRAQSDLRSFVVQAPDGALKLSGAERGNLQLRHPVTRSLLMAAQTGFARQFLDHFSMVEDDGSACGGCG